MLSLLQYISFYFNINIATFVGFQIAVCAYVVLRTLHTLRYDCVIQIAVPKHSPPNSGDNIALTLLSGVDEKIA